MCMTDELQVLEHANLGSDLKRGAQFDVHGPHEMVLLQQEKCLSVDLLRAKALGDFQTTCRRKRLTEKGTNAALHAPAQMCKYHIGILTG